MRPDPDADPGAPEIGGYATHPAADAFPMLEGAAFDELVADIRANGLREPIWLLDGAVLDGRNRLRACVEAGVDPTFRTYTGSDPAGFVVSMNLARRHLDASQRAMIAAKLATLPAHRPGKSANLPGSATQARAAAIMHVSERSVRSAREVLAKGTPELVLEVEQGKIAVATAAGVARQPARTQRAIARRIDAGATPADAIREAAPAPSRSPPPPSPTCPTCGRPMPRSAP